VNLNVVGTPSQVVQIIFEMQSQGVAKKEQ